ncbi:hypothetical protein BS47DRAFT_1370996 [Hydnum rufescens UP504]|uniref:Uncharacterized protein n=1 Tax=Hydnum rufescens UP504 TaxID=1448309 RepID=A0A9P6B675_9AGAM|nr:hypothetical protein BS47DRAFT_1370996 [Hydnum rufescens UP504]
MLSALEVARHNSRESCWIIIAGFAYDVTEFLGEHPGGAAIILKYAGQDVTEVYESLHPPSALADNLPSEKKLGPLSPVTNVKLPPFTQMISLLDFEKRSSPKAWAYFSSGATDMSTLALNRATWNSILLIPRVMVDVTKVDTSTILGGTPAALPLLIAPTGMAKLSHPQGEVGFAEGAGHEGIPFTVSTNASAGLDDIISGRTHDNQPFFFQLYMNRDRPKSSALIKKNGARIFKAIILTVDAPWPGKREADERVKNEVVLDLGVAGGRGSAPDSKGAGVGRAMAGYIDANLNWSDIAWIRAQLPTSSSPHESPEPDMLIGVKGVQSVQDVLKAISLGVNIIWLSNHGGRSLDTTPPALYVLLELRRDHPWVFALPHVEIYVDGGVRRGTDVVKALCLGARGVALGRPFMYALQYGTEGVRAAVQILRDEIETTMRLIGARTIAELGPQFLNTKALMPLLNDPVPSSSSPVRSKL